MSLLQDGLLPKNKGKKSLFHYGLWPNILNAYVSVVYKVHWLLDKWKVMQTPDVSLTLVVRYRSHVMLAQCQPMQEISQ